MARLGALSTMTIQNLRLRSRPLNLAPQRPNPHKHSQTLTHRVLRTGLRLTTRVFSVRRRSTQCVAIVAVRSDDQWKHDRSQPRVIHVAQASIPCRAPRRSRIHLGCKINQKSKWGSSRLERTFSPQKLNPVFCPLLTVQKSANRIYQVPLLCPAPSVWDRPVYFGRGSRVAAVSRWCSGSPVTAGRSPSQTATGPPRSTSRRSHLETVQLSGWLASAGPLGGPLPPSPAPRVTTAPPRFSPPPRRGRPSRSW